MALTVEIAMNENGEAEVTPLWDVQPVEFGEKRRHISNTKFSIDHNWRGRCPAAG